MGTTLDRDDLEHLRARMAAGTLTPAEIGELIETCEGLLAVATAAAERQKQMAGEVDDLRPVVAELRRRLTTLSSLLTR